MYAPYLTPRSRSLSPIPSPTSSNLPFVYTTKLPEPFSRRVRYDTIFKIVRYLLMFIVFTINPLVFLRVLVVVNLVRYIWWP